MPKRFRVWIAAFLLVAPAARSQDLDAASRDVERLRGISFAGPVAQRTIDRSDLRDVLRREIAKSLPYSAEDYVTVLRALQLVDASPEATVDKMLDLYESQVLAFYDPSSHTYFAIRQMPAVLNGLAGAETLRQSVVVHELTHALQDQRFSASTRDFALRRDADAQLAYHALLEGEASVVMLAWLLEKTGQSFDEAIKNDAMLSMMSSTAAEQGIAPGTPRYFIESLKFPYAEGIKLVAAAYRRGGWKEVDRLHANPPSSTREIIHVEEYFARLDRGETAPAAFEPASAPPDTLTVEHLGEFHWRFLVGDHATGWKNDRVTIGCDGLVHVETWWDDPERASSFRDAYVSLLRNHDIEPRVGIDGAFVDVLYRPR
ncbi:MAG: hypothetical protein QOK07_2971 [Gemmatimonadaceae bacterium]|nr:hypothetical protein [Gemmatimonadaceae bacterium]